VLSLAAVTAATTQASATSTSFNVWDLVQFGLLGIGFACLVTGKGIVTERELRKAEERHAAREADLKEENTRLRDQVDRLQGITEQQMIPALTRATEIVAKYTEEQQRERLLAEARELRDGRS
jgi:uncharacterized protein YlxW (UPF0749 family)